MSTERDVERIVRSWMDEGVNALPDRVLDLVLDQIPATPQRRAGWPARRFPVMNSYARLGLIAAAAVVIAVVVGAQLFGSPSGGIGSQPTPTPTPTPEPSPTATSRATPPVSPPPLTKTFTSTLHGISVSYPEGWAAQPATEHWTSDTFPESGSDAGPVKVPQIDWLYDPNLTYWFVAIASQPIGDSTPEDWVAERIAPHADCGAVEPIVVDGATGLIENGCANEAVVTTAGRGYVIQLYAGIGSEAAVFDELAWFDEILATVQLHPEDAVD